MNNSNNLFNFIFSFLLLALISSCSSHYAEHIKEGKAYYRYFKYDGHDTFYDQHPIDKSKQFYNPILPGFYPDPSICQRGEDYFLVTSTFSFFPGIPIYHSRDLVNWKLVGHVLERPSQYMNRDQPISYGIFAPALSYNPKNETFYLTTTFVGGGGNFIVTAKDPAGDWSDPVWIPEVEGIDPSLFFDDDGKAYLVNNGEPEGKAEYSGHRAIWIQEFDVENQKMIGPRKVLINGGHDFSTKPIWIEGPHIYKIKDYYFLMAAEGGTSINHTEVIFRSKNVFGPYERNPNNPILTQKNLPEERDYPITNAGHADLFQDKAGNWYSIFLACRPYRKGNIFNIGRETFIHPVTWEKDWPTILESGKTIPMVLDLPEGVTKSEDKAWMPAGNFSYTDDFKSDSLAMEWMFLRTPTETEWYTLNRVEGGIWLDPQPTNLREMKHTAFLGRRQQHHDFTLETAIRFVPMSEQDFAGISLFQRESHYLNLGLTKDGTKTILALCKSQQGEDGLMEEKLASVALPIYDEEVKLKVQCENGIFSFLYQLENEDWKTLKTGIDAAYLSTAEAGGFIGTVMALYTTHNN
ncbi:glycoside hydrolase family 43 protein [Limibacter armeniacum]|uniref:glycoside hydrolase family 43 protein n=1 Tax=Limibacter armeniacum TaxID=466084 RepID=UPI002FE5E4EE